MNVPKRRSIRYSLITLLVAVNVAGVLVWINLRLHGPWFQRGSGWPYMYSYWTDAAPEDLETGVADHDIFHPFDLLINVGIAIAIIAAVAVFTEFLVRRFHKAKRRDG